jgi:hypothetical protein
VLFKLGDWRSDEYYTSSVTVLVAMAGWAATHLLAIRHTLKVERRKSRVEFLIKTYKKITELRVFAEGQDSESIARFLCDISADIELQGTKTQAELIAKATSDILQNGSLATLDKLAQDLLDDLRGNMKLVKVERQASIFGYTRKMDINRTNKSKGADDAVMKKETQFL